MIGAYLLELMADLVGSTTRTEPAVARVPQRRRTDAIEVEARVIDDPCAAGAEHRSRAMTVLTLWLVLSPVFSCAAGCCIHVGMDDQVEELQL